MGKKTLVLGATTNPERTAYTAIYKLKAAGHALELIGIKQGSVAGYPIQHGMPAFEDIDTVTLYLGPARQPAYYDYILSLEPKRIIFNPGTENMELAQLAKTNGIEVEIACTLVLLSLNQY